MSLSTLFLENLTLGYERHPAVHHLDLRIEPASLVAIIGPNGAGKSTLLKGMAGLLRPLQGRIRGLDGQRVAYLPQLSEVDRSFPINVVDMVALGLWREVGALGAFNSAHRERCRVALAAVGLTGFDHRPLDTLSGGQFQRALFARLILQDASVLLLDEPFAAVDERTTGELMSMLRTWQREGRTVIAVLHDLDLARRNFDHALLLAREAIAWGPPNQVLMPAQLARARGLHEAFDDDAATCETPRPAVLVMDGVLPS
ncbi:zinc ABC transporter ATP-binding protein AztA [Ottowia sp. VDI28]|uniref:zinc ABC transporter ATP-binding protein AztA n=1 Tax=Ottowia sp. VDI28 TaxID=3133968 RepID=UPI003C2CAB36